MSHLYEAWLSKWGECGSDSEMMLSSNCLTHLVFRIYFSNIDKYETGTPRGFLVVSFLIIIFMSQGLQRIWLERQQSMSVIEHSWNPPNIFKNQIKCLFDKIQSVKFQLTRELKRFYEKIPRTWQLNFLMKNLKYCQYVVFSVCVQKQHVKRTRIKFTVY